MRRIVPFILVIVGILIIAGIFLVQPMLANGGSCTQVGGDLIITSQQSCTGDATSIGGNLIVQGRVEGNAIAVGGSVQIEGEVSGSVISVGGEILLQEGAQVKGDVIALEGDLQRAPNATVKGDLLESSLFLRQAPASRDRPAQSAWTRLGITMLVTTLTFGLCLLLAVILHGTIPRRTRVMTEMLRERLFPSLGLGIATTLILVPLLPLASLFLMLLIIGLPLIPFLYLLAGLIWAAGLTVTSLALGELFLAQRGISGSKDWHSSALGLVILVPLTVLPAVFVPCLGPAWALLVPSGGVGAILLSRAGTMA